MKDLDRALLSSVRLRKACAAVAKRLGQKVAAEKLGYKAEADIGQRLDEGARHYLKPHELIALMRLDAEGTIFSVLCDELGYEMPERKRELNPGEKLERIESAAQELFGPEVLELLRQKAGL